MSAPSAMSYKSVLSTSNGQPGPPSQQPGVPTSQHHGGPSSLHQSLYGTSSWSSDIPPPPRDSTPSIYPPAKPVNMQKGHNTGVQGTQNWPPSFERSFSSSSDTEDQRKKSIDAFLSQSPSQALGDAFVGMGLEEAPTNTAAQQAPSSSSKVEGVGGVGVGASKTSDISDEWAGDNVQASAAEFVPSQFHYEQQAAEDSYSDPASYASGSQQSYGNVAVPAVGLPSPSGFSQPQVVNASQPQQGVFYMAVNVNGQQVLQPVQLVQLPNGQMATVLANPPAMHDGGAGASGLTMGYDQSFEDDYDDSGRRKRNGQKKKTDDFLKHDLSPIDTPADLKVDNQNSDIHALYGSTRRPALKDLLGNVRRLSKDQVGCRLLQQALGKMQLLSR